MNPLIFLDTRSRRRDDGVPAAPRSTAAFLSDIPHEPRIRMSKDLPRNTATDR